MNLSGIVAHVQPVCLTALRGRLADLAGVEIHAVKDDGRLVISVEDAPETAPAELLERVRHLPDVLSAAMIYSYSGSMQKRTPFFAQDNDRWRGTGGLA